MWSLGALTTALLAGRSIFINTQASDYRHDSSAAILKAASECDLTILDESPFWRAVDVRARDFIKKLLRLDERLRLTAGQALDHGWFTEGHGKEIVQQTYDRAISGWLPTRPGWDFEEELDKFIKARGSTADVCLNYFYMLSPQLRGVYLQYPLLIEHEKHGMLGIRELQDLPNEQIESRYFLGEREDGAASAHLTENEIANSLPWIPGCKTAMPTCARKRTIPCSPEMRGCKTEHKAAQKQLVRNPKISEKDGLSNDGNAQGCEKPTARNGSDHRHSSFLDEHDYALRNQVSRENPIFRSARSFGMDVAKRRKFLR